MPNWCQNDLEVTGPLKELKRFFKHAQSDKIDPNRFDGKPEPLDMEKFIPYPKKYKEKDEAKNRLEMQEQFECEKADYKNMDIAQQNYFDFLNPRKSQEMKDGFNEGGYEWCVANRGTKWNFCDTGCNVDDIEDIKDAGYLQYYFQTAWSPPCPVIAKMAEMFPKLKFVLEYSETGCAFKGTMVCENGEVIEDSCREFTREDWEEEYRECPDILQDMFPGEYDNDGNRIKKEDDNNETGDN